MLEVSATAEVLPVRILNPSSNYIFVAEVVSVFEIMQAHHKPDRLGGSALSWVVEFTKSFFKFRWTVLE